MAEYIVENEQLKIVVDDAGAELKSIVRKLDQREYMWCGDAAYWGRVSPVLFPFVGKVKDGIYRFEGKEYTGIPQHGFARDSVFACTEKLQDTIWFELRPDEMWKSNYPFQFLFRVGYKIEGNSVHVMWNVINEDTKTMYFSLGAHPAFMCENNSAQGQDKKVGCKIDLHAVNDTVTSGILSQKGVLTEQTKELPLENGCYCITEDSFEQDALILDSKEIHTVTLIDGEEKPFLQVRFDAPQLGLWSPVGKKAPFVCIEPWFGRCDRETFDGTLNEREYGNSLEPGHSFNKEYVIDIL